MNSFFFNFQGTQLIDCRKFHPTLFKLFIYSILWRCSISSLEAYDAFKISSYTEEKIRVFLDSNLRDKKKDLIDNLSNCKFIPDYHLCIIKSKNSTRTSGEMLAAYSEESGAEHIISLLNFFTFFYEDNTIIHRSFLRISNKQNNMVIIGTGEQEDWEALLSLQLNKFNRERVLYLNKKTSD